MFKEYYTIIRKISVVLGPSTIDNSICTNLTYSDINLSTYQSTLHVVSKIKNSSPIITPSLTELELSYLTLRSTTRSMEIECWWPHITYSGNAKIAIKTTSRMSALLLKSTVLLSQATIILMIRYILEDLREICLYDKLMPAKIPVTSGGLICNSFTKLPQRNQ